LDKFPEAFKRFEAVVDVSKIKSFQQLLTAFMYWAGRKWKGTPLQVEALRVEAVKIGLLPPISEEEFKRQKRLVDELYRRVYYAYRRLEYNQKRLEEWQSYYARMMERAEKERWTPREIASLQKWVLPRIRSAEQRRDRWLREWSEAFERLKVERDKLKGFERQLEEWRKRRRVKG
jgi:hypothetical protein